MSGDILAFIPAEATLDMTSDDGFCCMVCGHWTYISETNWADYVVDSNNSLCHMHGREEFHFCPNCGTRILSLDEWVDYRPQDGGKTVSEIKRTFRMEDA